MPDSQPASEPHTDIKGCQIRETVMMLNLAIVRIEHAMREGSESIGTLTHSFTSMVDSVQNIKTATEPWPGVRLRPPFSRIVNRWPTRSRRRSWRFSFTTN